jgi:hypothetical protein
MSRLFWLGLGVAAGVLASRKIAALTHKATPAGVAENLGDAMREMAGALGSFGAEVRAGMAERENQLTEEVEAKTGFRPGSYSPGETWSPSTSSRRPRRDARAPRADR